MSDVPEYTTEARLDDIFSSGAYEFKRNKGVKESGTRFRPDFLFEELKLIVEFDGSSHYTKSHRILKDMEKDSIFEHMGYKIIRLPYFIQFSSEVYDALFVKQGYDLGIDRSLLVDNYPHGFIDKKATLPIDFCLLGLEKFFMELAFDFFPQEGDVFDSLLSLEFDHGISAYPRSTFIGVEKLWYGFKESRFDSRGLLKCVREAVLDD